MSRQGNKGGEAAATQGKEANKKMVYLCASWVKQRFSVFVVLRRRQTGKGHIVSGKKVPMGCGLQADCVAVHSLTHFLVLSHA